MRGTGRPSSKIRRGTRRMPAERPSSRTRRATRRSAKLPSSKKLPSKARRKAKVSGRISSSDVWGEPQRDPTSEVAKKLELELLPERPRPERKDRLITYGSGTMQYARAGTGRHGRVPLRPRQANPGPPMAAVIAVPCLLLLLGAAVMISSSDAPQHTPRRTTAPAITAPAHVQSHIEKRRVERERARAERVERERAPGARPVDEELVDLSPAEEEARIKALADRERELQANEEKWLKELQEATADE